MDSMLSFECANEIVYRSLFSQVASRTIGFTPLNGDEWNTPGVKFCPEPAVPREGIILCFAHHGKQRRGITNESLFNHDGPLGESYAYR
jgi:hypothetical protein